MDQRNPFNLLYDLTPKPATISGDVVTDKMGQEDLIALRKIGIRSGDLMEMMQHESQISYNRYEMYQDISRAADHWMVGSGVELYAEVATNYSQLHNASVWVNSDSDKYHRILSKMLNDIHIEEKIFDWAYSLSLYGDMFVRVNAKPGLGIVSVDDNEHPINIGRLDYEGALIGFYHNSWGAGQQNSSNTASINKDTTPLIPPWEFVHFRVLGAKKTRALAGDPLHSEFRSLSILGSSGKQYTSKYGTSVIINGLAPYKRLRMAEDSILLARLTRGILRYIYKLKVDSGNAEAVAELMDQYTTMLKNARSIDTENDGQGAYDSKSNPFSSMEDIIVPVWGNTNDLEIEHVGGDPNIRWIVDIDELRNQLAAAIRVPLSLLGAYTKDASGALGSEAIEKLDIRFARCARRIQRSLVEGITRLCQIHLAWMNMDPDESLFQINMAETSSAEEESLRESLDTGVDTIQKFMDMLSEFVPNLDRVEVFNYLNQKILKLEDFDVKDYLLADQIPLPELTAEANQLRFKKMAVEHSLLVEKLRKGLEAPPPLRNSDIHAYLPMKEGCKGRGKRMHKCANVWESRWSAKEVEYELTEHTTLAVSKHTDELNERTKKVSKMERV